MERDTRRFFGAYFSGLRQGTGVYHYAGGVPGQLSGIYMGEWVKGLMNGYGILLYTDGESYVGQWKHDKKNGLGTYVWGKNAGDFVDDKYEGQFHDGTQNGTGRTVFADGGWHKACPRLESPTPPQAQPETLSAFLTRRNQHVHHVFPSMKAV